MAIKSFMVVKSKILTCQKVVLTTPTNSSATLGAPGQTVTNKSAALERIVIFVAIEFKLSFVIILRHYWENV